MAKILQNSIHLLPILVYLSFLQIGNAHGGGGGGGGGGSYNWNGTWNGSNTSGSNTTNTTDQSSCPTFLIDTSFNFIDNGDFESPVLTPNFRWTKPGSLAGWVSSQSQIGKGVFYNQRWTSQVLELDGSRFNIKYNKTLTLTAGLYRFKLECAARDDGNRPLNTSGFAVTINGVTLLTQNPPPDKLIHQFDINFTAISGTNKITLEGKGTPDSFGTTCDNLKLYKVSIDTYRRYNNVTGTCNCLQGYYDDFVNMNCQKCSDQSPQCLACTNSSIGGGNYQFSCTKCSWGFYPVGTGCQSCSLTVAGCLQCAYTGTSGNACSQCDSSKHWILANEVCECEVGYYQDGNIECLFCGDVDSNCRKCSNSVGTVTCQSCQIGYYPDGANCVSCNVVHVACLKCDGTICTQCDTDLNWQLDGSGKCRCKANHYQNLTTLECSPCSMLHDNCTDCLSYYDNTLASPQLYECLACAQGWFPASQACQFCNTTLPGCLSCSSTGLQCLSCNQSQFYFLASYNPNITNPTQCTSCFVGLQQCTSCTSLQVCTACNQSNQYFLNSLSKCELCSLTQCIACSSLSQCLTCNETSRYFRNQTSKQCQYCDMMQCVSCQSLQICQACNESNNYFLNASTHQCDPCTLLQCINCQSFTSCAQCNQIANYFINESTLLCQPCILEGCLHCSSLSDCYECDITHNYLLDNTTNRCFKCTLEGCSKCITNQTCEICLSLYILQSQALICEKRPGCASFIQNYDSALSNPAIPPTYSIQNCQTAQKLQKLSKAMAITGYITMFSSLASVKIVGLQLFGVLQMTYFNLADHSFVNLYLSPFLDWKFMNGYNIAVQKKQLQQYQKGRSLFIEKSNQIIVPANIQAIGYTHSFIQNMNVMLFVLVSELLISLILILLSRRVHCLRRIGYFCIKQVFLTLFIFNSFNIAFSTGLHFKYATVKNTQNFIISTFACITALVFCAGIILAMIVLDRRQFGEYNRKFKKGFVTEMYIAVSIIYRMAVGFYMAYGNDHHYGTLFIISLSLIYLLYNMTNLPFTDAYQNYRANFCHFCQFAILLVANFYTTMKQNDAIQNKSQIFLPAIIQISLILICIIISLGCLIYELYLLIRKKWSQKIRQRKISTSQAQKSKNCLNVTTQANQQFDGKMY